jgi:hypothetical protein
LSTRELILAKLKKNSVDSYEDEPTKTSKIVSVVFEGSPPLISEEKKETEIPPKEDQPDPVSLAERIGIKYEAEIPTPEGTGASESPSSPTRGMFSRGRPTPPHVRFYAWCTVNLFPGRPLAIDTEPVARLLELAPREVREAISKLVMDGDLDLTRERGRELYRLNVQYREVGTVTRHEDGGSHETRV